MSLYRDKDSPFWYYDVRINGQRERGSTKQRTKGAAKTFEDQVRMRLAEGKGMPSATAKMPTLREFSVRFLTWAENTRALEPATKKFYRFGCRLLLFTRLAGVSLDHLTSELIECTPFTRPVISKSTLKPTGEIVECSPTYTNQALRTLKAMMGKAVEWNVLSTRPTVSTLKAKRRQKTISPDAEIQMQAAFEAPTVHGKREWRRHRAWLVMVILQDTGMRPEEVFAMRIDHIRWDVRAIWVPEGKTDNATRWVGMSERMVHMMQKWCLGREGWVFPNSRSKSGHLEGIWKSFKTAKTKAGLPDEIVLYSTRHTYGTFQMEATGNIFAVSKQMGHANVKSMEPYQHPDTSELNKSIDERNRAREQRRFALLTESGQSFGQTSNLIQ